MSSVRSLPAVPESVGLAREAMGELALAAGATADQADAIRLAISEAVTNAVIHGYRGVPGEIRIDAEVIDGVLSILICDAGVGLHRQAEHPGLGLGLGIIARLSDEMELIEDPAGGTEVQMRFGLHPGRGPRRSAAPGMAGQAARAAA